MITNRTMQEGESFQKSISAGSFPSREQEISYRFLAVACQVADGKCAAHSYLLLNKVRFGGC